MAKVHDLEHDLIQSASKLPPLKVAVVHPVDERSFGGAIRAAKKGLITPVLIAPSEKLKAIADKTDVSLDEYEIISVDHSHHAAERAVVLASQGDVDALMKGKIHTDEFMHAIVVKDAGLRTGRRMSHIFVAYVPQLSKRLYITDAAVNIRPSLSAKVSIVQNSIDLFTVIEGKKPNVALLSAAETVDEKIPSTLDATALCKMSERSQIIGAHLDGPLAFDNAISVEAAKLKGIHSKVAGRADILVTPDIISGNVLLKQLIVLQKAQIAGIVMGASIPIILTSRVSEESSRVASCALAQLWTHRDVKL